MARTALVTRTRSILSRSFKNGCQICGHIWRENWKLAMNLAQRSRHKLAKCVALRSWLEVGAIYTRFSSKCDHRILLVELRALLWYKATIGYTLNVSIRIGVSCLEPLQTKAVAENQELRHYHNYRCICQSCLLPTYRHARSMRIFGRLWTTPYFPTKFFLNCPSGGFSRIALSNSM